MDEIIREALSKGVEMHVAGEFDLASQLYASVIKLNPNHADANHNMGLLKLDMGHDLDALPYLQTALQADTTIAQFWISYIKALIQLGRHDEASRILNLAKENSFEGGEFVELQQQLNPLTTAKIAETEIKTSIQYEHNILNSLKLDKALKLAKKHVKEGSSEEALHIYRNILEKFPQNRTALKGLASVNKSKSSSATDSPSQETVNQLINLYNQGKLEQVVEQAEALTQTYPEAFIIWNVLGTAQKDLGKLKEAVKTYSIAISIKPDFAEAYNNMGIALKNSGKLTEAIIAYEKASLIKPDYAEAHSNLANALYMQGKVDEAILAYEKAIRIKPDFVDAYINLGIIQKDYGKLDEVIKTFEKLLSIKPDHAESYLNIGNALQKKGKLDEAVKAYSRAIKIKPDFAEAILNVSELLKIQNSSPFSETKFTLIDRNVVTVGRKILSTSSDSEIAQHLSNALDYIREDTHSFETPFSQILKRSHVDLNCKRHKTVFTTRHIISKFCFQCFKVQVEVNDVFSLIRLTKLFYDLEFDEDLNRKTMIELRPDIPGFYKGLFFCRGLEQAQQLKEVLDDSLMTVFNGKALSTIKRGCSEFSQKFPDYAEIRSESTVAMDYPIEWHSEEEQFDSVNPIQPDKKVMATKTEFCLSDFYIIQKWIDYARGLNDPSCEWLKNKNIVFEDVYKIAAQRKLEFGKVF